MLKIYDMFFMGKFIKENKIKVSGNLLMKFNFVIV